MTTEAPLLIGTFSHAISVDIETLGLGPQADIIQIGAALFDVNASPGTVEDSLEFYVWRKKFDNVEPYAAAMNSEILYAIASVPNVDRVLELVDERNDYPGVYVTPEYAVEYLNNWSRKKRSLFKDGKAIFCGKNFASFDKPKLQALGDLMRSHHRFPDPGNLFWRPEEDGAVLPDSKTCMERAGMAGEVAHTALEDAIMVAKMIQVWAAQCSTS